MSQKFGYAVDRLSDDTGSRSAVSDAEKAAARRLVEKHARDDEDLAGLLAALDLMVSAA